MTLPEAPHNIEAEQAVLGSILLNRDAIVAVASWLQAEYFYMQRHAQIYEAMLTCYNARIPPDIRTVSEELRRRDRLDGVGGVVYLAQLVDQVPTSYHVEYYARIVERTALLRKLIEAGGKIAALGYDEQDDLEATLDRAEQTLFEVSQRRNTQDFVHIGQVIDAYYEQINYLQEHRGEVVGVPTGYRDLDQITGGLQRSDLIILAARPGVGKTSLVMSLAYNVALHHQGTVGVFSLEMSRDQLVQRLLSMETQIDTHRLRLGQLREEEMERVISAMGRLAAAPIYIEDTAGLSIAEVRSKARRLQSQAGVDLLIIDYLQLMQGRRTDNRVQEVSEISRGLKALARELNVPVIALSQLSRAVEGRTSHVPMLSDLRESGCLAGETLVYLPDERGYRRIDSLAGRSGFNVLALNTATWKLERRLVLRAFATGRKPVLRLTTHLGRSIRATANHKFLTIQGWKRLDELAPGMRLALPRPGFQAAVIGPGAPGLAGIGAEGQGHAAVAGDGAVGGVAVAARDNMVRAMGATATPLRRCGTSVADCAAMPDRGTWHHHAPMPDAAHGDVLWDDIVAIAPDGVAHVYDLTVEGLHNFISNDTFCHNSIEQDADIVMFIYREELYDPNTEKKGIAEIHIAKHRNGPVGVVPMRFDPATTRFYDLTYRTPDGY
ncbi:MAG TPA: replicative DNA helicase [Roseiflexaceae bacterium]|nr:replicative DNA helicase [Roseiflexaceae bacterium]